MARPRKEGLDYFPHDVDASSDEKIEALRSLYGNDGYAFYFIMLERIYRTPDFELDVSDAETRQILAKKVAVTPEKFDQMLQTALKWGCFDREAYETRGVLTSAGIKKRAQVVVEKRRKMRERYAKLQLEASRDEGDVSCEVSDAKTEEETPTKMPQSKVKESKRKDIYTPPNNVPPYAEIIAYLNERAGTKYRPSTEISQRLIRARWNEGFTLDDFKLVIDNKVAEWKGTEMEPYLRPQTLFSTKFEAYLNQRPQLRLVRSRDAPGPPRAYAPGQDPNKEVIE